MGIYLYAILPAGLTPPAGLTGVGDAAVDSVDTDDLTLWISAMERAPAASIDGIRSHNRVVEEAMRVATPVPVRFGQWVESRAALLRSVSEKAETYHSALEQVRDAVEFGVRVIDPELAQAAAAAPAQDRTSGTAYLQSLARAQTERSRLAPRARAVADSLTAALGDLVRAHREEPLPSSHGLFSAAHLVARHEISRYRSTLDSFRARTEDLHFLVSGPWPPYSFVG